MEVLLDDAQQVGGMEEGKLTKILTAPSAAQLTKLTNPAGHEHATLHTIPNFISALNVLHVISPHELIIPNLLIHNKQPFPK